MLLNLCDASSPEAAEHLRVTRELLASLGCIDRPILTVFNKCDSLPGSEILLPGEDRQSLRISARTGEGCPPCSRPWRQPFPDRRTVRLLLPFGKGRSQSGAAGKARWKPRNTGRRGS